ncbi:hypothetical protein SBI67_28545 [Mycolicibacterium sp. 120266]|uniref:LppU/SCO3897 family protein n=1 Tax=Mycolicibacterium sp. 120266 TaxID=3090601 RepID=UPI00299E3F5E|nr:hypothetical protein [Mycolicibacterium sp. 120266]MDX1876087.1 hypothetical protein [Mycolicibacterium sp. 120266]
MTDEGYGRGLIPLGLTLSATIAVAGGWNGVALRGARRVGDGKIRRRPVLIGEAVAMGPLALVTLLLLFSNQTIAVWLFVLISIPMLFVGLLIATAPPPLSSDTALHRYLHADAITRRAHRKRRYVVWAVVVVVLAVGLLVLVTGFPSASEEKTAARNASDTSPTNNFANIADEFIATDRSSPLGAVGNCVSLTGPSRQDVTIKRVDCSTMDAAYRIVQLSDEPHQCVADVDQRYAPRKTDEGSLILCLDYNWATGLCIFPGATSGRWYAIRAECGPGGEEPTEVLNNVSNARGCPRGGYPHPVRRFAVCSTLHK